VPRGFCVSLRRSLVVVKNAAVQCNYLNPGNVSVTRNRLCTELCTGMGDMSKTRLSECVGRTLTSPETQSTLVERILKSNWRMSIV
jgi:hypothetical protein